MSGTYEPESRPEAGAVSPGPTAAVRGGAYP
jgi:hypothetical protein